MTLAGGRIDGSRLNAACSSANGVPGETRLATLYYSDVGLLSVTRRVGGKRRFDPTAIARVRFIRRCQESGFALDEIGTILHENSGHWRLTVDAKLIELRDLRERLDETIELLTEVRACGCAAVDQCESLLRC